ncbi:MAG: hypothetical protein PHF63_02455 [Herbinix sp.]|nr:hypothetical protein [Herbinix sp.]
MHLSTKKLAFLGLLMAITVLLIILSEVLDFNTLFLLAGASFCVGIAFRESGIMFAFGFYFASLILGFLLAPNKLYCITYSAMGLYLLISEYSYDKLINIKSPNNRRIFLWIIKFAVFNIMYIPAVVFLPKLFYEGDIFKGILAAFILVGQIALFVYDMAYNYFQRYVWGKVRGNLKLNEK